MTQRERPADMPAVTERQAEYLVAIDEMIESNRLFQPPTLKQLSAKFGVSINAAHQMVEALKSRRLLECDPYHDTSYRVTDRGRIVIDTARSAD